jgi:hypothetical protein
MKVTNARSPYVHVGKDNLLPAKFVSALIVTSAPGFHQHTYGNGSVNLDTTLALLFKDCDTEQDISDVRDSLADMFSRFRLADQIVAKIWQKPYQSIVPNLIQLSVPEIEEGMSSVLSQASALTTVPFMTEMFLTACDPLKIVHPYAGFSYFEDRNKRHPDDFELQLEMAKLEMKALLEQHTFSFVAKAGKGFIPKSIITDMAETFTELAIGMRRLGYYNDYLMDSYYIIAKLAGNDSLITAGIPKSVADSRAVAELRANLTFTQLALQHAPENIVTAEWDLQHAVDTVVEQLYLSKRIQPKDLSTSVAHYRYTNVIDGRSNVVGGVLSPHLTTTFDTEVAVFTELDNLTKHRDGTKLPTYSAVLSGMFEPLSTTNIFNRAHQASVSLLSIGRIHEGDDDSRSTLLNISQISENDVLHLAAAKADALYYHVTDDRELVLIFKKELNGLRVKMEELAFADVVYTDDPSTLILCCESFDEKTAFVYKKKSIDEKSWRSRFLDIAPHLRNFSTESKFQFIVDNNSLSVQTNLVSLLHLRARTRAELIHDQHVADWMTDSFIAPFVALSVVMPELRAMADDEYVVEPGFIQLGHIIASALEPIMRTRHFQVVVEDLIRRAANRSPKEAREASYQKLHQAHLLKQVQIEAALFIMSSIGLTTDISLISGSSRMSDDVIDLFRTAFNVSDATSSIDVNTIYETVLGKSHYYQHLIGAALADIDKSMQEMD